MACERLAPYPDTEAVVGAPAPDFTTVYGICGDASPTLRNFAVHHSGQAA